MKIVPSILEMQDISRQLRRSGARIGLVPTMGALHEGHLSLVRSAKSQCSHVVTSIFVNPLQFGANEDFTRYPRTFGADSELLEQEHVEVLFAPSAAEMCRPGAETFVEVPDIGARLDGASRPGHFRGVTTIVSKLFHIVRPDLSFFGQKDAAQVTVLRRMIRDLNFQVQLCVCPTVREPDGLAMSSRNRYLTAQERDSALALSRALQAAEARSSCTSDAVELRQVLLEGLRRSQGVRIDYAAVVDPDTLEETTTVSQGALLAVAAWVGSTRLIDNLLLAPRRIPS